MRVGIFGGTFDPIHLGHLILAEFCREEAHLDRIQFIPAGMPPHKQDRHMSPAQSRAEMLEFAIAGHAEFSINRLEIKRTGPSFTVETLRTLHQEQPGDEFCLLMGADSLADFHTWKEPREIAELASLVVVNRGHQPPPDLESMVPLLGEAAVSRMQVVNIPAIEISASEIRRRVQAGQSIRFLVPRAVERYIIEKRLYVS